ncbi:sensor histidine kinase [Frigidibacter oleivorans]|uniref:sensor histidine kinase n=1 Tax=Frigidibacter oleivorans TaxID=2487129 RepID=UPI000F8D7323|nr:sensor histidine kinase [Frigidibacter oleivorans]
MKTGLRGRLRFTERLGFRLAFLLSVALLPLGMIALAQTWQMARDADKAAEQALIQRTSDAVASERAILENALGASAALIPSVLDRIGDADACSQVLTDFVNRSPIFSFAGLIETDGMMRCSSSEIPRDMSDTPTYRSFMANPGAQVTANERGRVTGQPVLIVSQPVTRDGVLLGLLTISVPHATLQALRSGGGQRDRSLALVMFTSDGTAVFSNDHSLGDTDVVLPQGLDLTVLAEAGTQVFRGRDHEGKNRVFVVFPAVPGLVNVLGSWPAEAVQLGRDLIAPTTLLFPLTMWLTSLVVAYAAIDRLVIRHVRELRGQMRRFALGRRNTAPEVLASAPAEIADVSQTFHNLARILIRDEAELEASLQEKTVLLKEVHHRVKNNLQLIASIMNMQIRQVKEPVARAVLKSVQDRVASLATIHRNLYQAETLSAVQADKLLGDIVSQMTLMTVTPGSNLRIETEFDPVILYPDQAVPVSLLATEALTNAIKYAVPPAGETASRIRIALKADGDRHAILSVTNSRGPGAPAEAAPHSGLGTQLIDAFAGQLGSAVELDGSDECYRLSLRFEVAQFDPATPGQFGLRSGHA